MGMGSVITSPFWPMQEGINEIIATIKCHAAPMGVICRDGRIMMAVFKTSHTAALIEETGLVVANIVHDPVLFVKGAFSDLDPVEFTEFEVDDRKVYRLSSAKSWVVYRARIDQKTEQKLLIGLDPISIETALDVIVPINRGLNNIIEAAVHGTRYIITRDHALKHMIDHHISLVKRCGGEREFQALGLLQEYIS
jgi:uncharacterized protein